MTESWLYCVDDKVSRDILRKIIDKKHEIGLHIDPCTDKAVPLDVKINRACKKLKKIIDKPVKSFAYHSPPKEYLGGCLTMCRRVNAYAEDLWDEEKKYRSDSHGCWKQGHPLDWLEELDEPLSQLLIHPIYWGDQHMSAEKRLDAYAKEEAPKYGKMLRHNIKRTINV